MPLYEEKRRGLDRRNQGMSSSKQRQVDRRKEDRRQVAITEISFMEWARQFASYKKLNMNGK